MVKHLFDKGGHPCSPLFLTIVLAVLSLSCTRHYAIENRAKQQIYASLPDELRVICPGMNDWRIEDLKTIYANDSICLLQCTARFHDEYGTRLVRDYRYIYLIDTDDSRREGRPVFREEFRNILCMPDKVIRQCRRDVRRNKENVYENSRPGCLRVRKPFDAQL